MKAIELCQQSCMIVKNMYGEGCYYADILEFLAEIYYENGDYDKSLKIAQKILSISQAYYGNDHLSAARSLIIAGKAYYEQSLTSDALKCYEKSILILKKFGQAKEMLLARN